MTTKKKIAKAYVEDCLGAEDIAENFSLRSNDSVHVFAEQVYGPTYPTIRKVNMRKLLSANYEYRYWPGEFD